MMLGDSLPSLEGNAGWAALLLGIVIAVTSAWSWMMGRMDKIADRAREDRHRLANQTQNAIAEVEDRLTARIEAIETREQRNRR